MTEALKNHVQDGEELSKLNVQLETSNRILEEDHDLHNAIVKEKIHQSRAQAREVLLHNLDICSENQN